VNLIFLEKIIILIIKKLSYKKNVQTSK
jgi:hypothetical protein